jgi:hypothetical protein
MPDAACPRGLRPAPGVGDRRYVWATLPFLLGLVAVGILYAVDHEYNDGLYSSVIQQAIAAIILRCLLKACRAET